jgi:hypothetical protein
MTLFQKPWIQKAIKGKVTLSAAETLREFSNWYNDTWKRDYPRAYNMRFKRRVPASGRRSYKRRKYTAKRRYKKRSNRKRLFSKTRLGNRVGTATAKYQYTLSDWFNYSSRTVAVIPLNEILKTTDNLITGRQRDIINLRGYRIQFHFKCNMPDFQYVNMAVIAPTEGITVGPSDFFKSEGSNTTRYRDFALDLSSLQFAELPINSDKYLIMKHKRWVINRSTRGTGTADFRTYSTYIPVKRQLTFDPLSSGGNSGVNERTFMIWWTDGGGVPAGSAVSENALSVAASIVTVFREPK